MIRAIHWAMAREAFSAALALMGLLFALRLLTGCHDGARSAESVAESAYTGELLRCVDLAATLEESRQCRQIVNERWGIVQTFRDAGADR